MSHAQLVVWIITLMVGLRTPGMESYIPEAHETRESALERYGEIAEAIATVSEEDPIYKGKYAAPRTAVLLVAIAFMESGFRKDIDLGLGRHRDGRTGENDHGRSWCMMQVMLGKKQVRMADGTVDYDSTQRTSTGWTGRDLVNDRLKCFRAGRDVLRVSMGTCRSLPQAERLAAFASGNCESEHGRRASRSRMQLAWRLWDKRPAETSGPLATVP